MTEIQKLIEKQGEAFEEFKKANDARLAEIEATGKASSESIAKLSAIETDLHSIRDQIADLEAKRSVPDLDPRAGKSAEEVAHLDAFDRYIREPKSPNAINALNEAATAVHKKDVTISGTGGGNAIPTEIHDRILNKVLELSPIRSIANVARSSNENRKFIVGDNDQTSGWAGAGGTRSATGTPLVQAVTLTYGTVYAYPTIQEEALNDIEFDVMAWLVDSVAKKIAQAEGAAFVSGDGSDKPTGFLNGTPVSTGDEDSPARAFGVLQYFPTGVAAAFPNDRLGSPAGDPAGPLFDLVYGVKKQYRQNANFVMNRATLSTLMQFRNADGDYLFRPRATAGVPDMLMGYPIVEAEDMSDIGANAFPVAFGDFSEGYQIADIVSTMRITVDDNITAPGFVKFYARRRVGGKVLNDDAIKLIKVAAS